VGELLLAAPVELKLVRTTSGCWAVRPRAVAAVGWRLYVGRYSNSSRCTIEYISMYSCTLIKHLQERHIVDYSKYPSFLRREWSNIYLVKMTFAGLNKPQDIATVLL
jgi:hypothetical protein